MCGGVGFLWELFILFYKPLTTNTKTEKKKKSLSFTPFVIARSKTTKQSITTNNKHKNQKEKEFIIIYQAKELIFNEILIFNFQFSIFYASFVSHFVGRQAKMIKQAYHFSTLCFNF